MTDFLDWARASNMHQGIAVWIFGFICIGVLYAVLTWCDRDVKRWQDGERRAVEHAAPTPEPLRGRGER
jgi:hypothetical protein